MRVIRAVKCADSCAVFEPGVDIVATQSGKDLGIALAAGDGQSRGSRKRLCWATAVSGVCCPPAYLSAPKPLVIHRFIRLYSRIAYIQRAIPGSKASDDHEEYVQMKEVKARARRSEYHQRTIAGYASKNLIEESSNSCAVPVILVGKNNKPGYFARTTAG